MQHIKSGAVLHQSLLGYEHKGVARVSLETLVHPAGSAGKRGHSSGPLPAARNQRKVCRFSLSPNFLFLTASLQQRGSQQGNIYVKFAGPGPQFGHSAETVLSAGHFFNKER